MKRWVFVLIVGIGFLVVSALFARENPNMIKCGGKIMSPGDVCETTKNGRSTGEDTYDEMKAAAESRAETFRVHGVWMIGVGVALTGLGATMLIRGKRRKARAEAAARPDAPPQPQPGFPPQQGFPQSQGVPQSQGFPQQPGNPQPYGNQMVQQHPQRQPEPQWHPGPGQQPYPQQTGWPQQPQQPPSQGGPPQQFGPRGH
ncbi:hypothetical protein [Amycolatopsis sp. lyj-112]|uniref:hypothetical protein n=1 Tax=Amycolatopsis sp. lyj-112 TaxID=2789288 RepID=UPI00397E4901